MTREQYDKIMRVYEQRRLENDYDLTRRRREVEAKLPAYRALQDEIAAASMQSAQAMVCGAGDQERRSLQERLAVRIREIGARQEALLQQAGYPADYLRPTYHCEKCQDTGFLPSAAKCSCFRQMEVEQLYDASRIKELLIRNNFDHLDTHYYHGEDLERFEAAVESSKKFINSFATDYHNMLFYGTVGTGKSFLSGCIAKELLDRGYSILYFSAFQLFSTLSAVLYSRDPEERKAIDALYDTLYETDLLIIDDLGTEQVNEFTRTQLFALVNERILRRKPIVSSTNLSLEELRNTYSERFTSRLMQESFLCRLSGKDIRVQMKLEQVYQQQ